MEIVFLPSFLFPSRSYIYIGTQLLLNEIHSVHDPFHAFPTTVEKEKAEILINPAKKKKRKGLEIFDLINRKFQYCQLMALSASVFTFFFLELLEENCFNKDLGYNDFERISLRID